MSNRTPEELLAELRTYLIHFDQNGDLGESDDVAEIKRHLRVRITEVEAALKHAGQRPNPRNPDCPH